MKPEVHFRKSAKSRMANCKSHDYKQQTLSSTTFSTAVKSVHLIFTTAILNLWWMWTSRDNGSGTIEKRDSDNMGTAVGILLLCALELEICLGVK